MFSLNIQNKARRCQSLFTILMLTLLLSGCSALSAFLPGGGTNVAANTQIGKENNQTGVQVGDVKSNSVEATEIGKLSQAETAIEAANVTINSLPPWVLLLIILGWILPSPMEIYRGLINAIKGSISYLFGGLFTLIKLFRDK
jgi:hypothetical protein